MPRIQFSTFLKHLVLTSATSVLITVMMILTMRFLARGLGPEEFGAYSLARRIIAGIAPLLILSTDVALSRYIAMTSEKRRQGSYVFSALIMTAMPMAVLGAAALLKPRFFSNLIFHNGRYLPLYYASLLLSAGYVLFVIAYCSLLGMQKIKAANAVQLGITGFLPMVIAYFFARSKSSSFIVLLMGLVFYLAVATLALIIKETKFPRREDIRSSMRELFHYSLPRVPAGFFLAAMLTLGPFLAGHFEGLEKAGFFVIAQSFLRIMESVVVAFGLIALPKISQILSQGKGEFLTERIEDLLIMIFQLGLFFTLHAFLWSKEIIVAWLGPEYLGTVPIMKVVILSLGPYIAYVLLRSVVDAVEVRAVNTVNLGISLSAALAASLSFYHIGLGIIGLAIGTCVGFATLGLMTSRYLIRRYFISLKNFMALPILGLNIFLALIIAFLKPFFVSSMSVQASVAVGLVLEILVFSGYLFFLYKKKTRWVLELKRRIMAESS